MGFETEPVEILFHPIMNHRTQRIFTHIILPTMSLLGIALGAAAYDSIYEHPPINYPTVKPVDPIAQLQKRIDTGQLHLGFNSKFGYLPAILKELNIPQSSQVLVFSKTSFQRDLISPDRPRALYFNDDTYIGFVQHGDVVEVSTTDPKNGPMFYSLRQKFSDKPALVRQTDACLQCHASSMTGDLPGHIVRSVYPDADGQPILSAGTFRTNPASPFKQRWGGWYVTGTSGAQKHMGNIISADKDAPEKTDFSAGTNIVNLQTRIDTAPYLSPHSDIVALMVLEHQTFVHNLITRCNYLTRSALYDNAQLNKALGRPANFRSESTTSRIINACEPLVKGLLFSEESPLTEAVEGTTTYAKDFAAIGPRDSQGRSLRDFDLKTRMFKYPCSYLIYSPSIDDLPAEAKEQLYKRLGEVLSGKDQSKDFAHLSAADRAAIGEILSQTKKGLPDFFKP